VADGVRGVPELRPHLRQVGAALLDVSVGVGRVLVERRRQEPPRPLVGVPVARRIEVGPGAGQVGAV
jgi:hypothetical protein